MKSRILSLFLIATLCAAVFGSCMEVNPPPVESAKAEDKMLFGYTREFDKRDFSELLSYSLSIYEGFDINETPYSVPVGDCVKERMWSEYIFNSSTVFEENADYAAELLEKAKNPGLGVRAIHELGITGKGVNVAIIDQPLAMKHPEFVGKITEYKDFCDYQEGVGSMHAPGVTGILAGETCGVAPGVNIYFAATPSWLVDAQYYADALRWIIETNAGLPDGEKIRVASFSGPNTVNYYPENMEAYYAATKEAREAGILVLDAIGGSDGLFINIGYYDIDAPDDISKFSILFNDTYERQIFAPGHHRTMAEEYAAGQETYMYMARGGISWSIPYIAGVLALGWEVDPTLTNGEIIRILLDTAYINSNDQMIVNPTAFINAVKEGK
ncbi:MAG: S8 family serine peptidase [Oscillospiraceae bacterium]|jgi:subtilisin family serine protease|nr:S8 family serine peptidase [Oscillospiraceae bacterium]